MGERFRRRGQSVFRRPGLLSQQKSKHFAPRGDLYMKTISPKACPHTTWPTAPT